jgi:formylmethanofuran--tetrahydromethanopterin N-formyltransferase
MKRNGVVIQNTFAEAWDLEVVRLVLTALTTEVAMGGAHQFAGAAGSSELGSRFNAGIERIARPQETPDGRPGVYLACTMPPDRRAALLEELALRLALATLIPTVAIFDAMVADVPAAERIDLYELTADRWQGYDSDRTLGGRHLCVVPTTTGEFVYETSVSLSTAGTDGHIVCYAASEAAAVLAVMAAKDAIAGVDGVCPMGYGLEQIYRELDYVPALAQRIEENKVPDGVTSVLNLLMFGATPALMQEGMRAAMEAAVQVPGLLQIGAMSFGGSFGRHQYHLQQLLAD